MVGKYHDLGEGGTLTISSVTKKSFMYQWDTMDKPETLIPTGDKWVDAYGDYVFLSFKQYSNLCSK